MKYAATLIALLLAATCLLADSTLVYRWVSVAAGGPTDPSYASVVSLMHLNGANASTTITDQKGNTTTATNGAAISTAQSQFGGSSLLLDGTDDFVQIANPGSAFDLGSSDFTFDWWFRTSNVSITSSKPMWSWRHTGAANNTQFAANLRSGAIRVTVSFDGVTDNTFAAFGTGAMSLVNDTWHFCRITRSGADYKLFIDGVQKGTTYTPAGNPSFTNLSRDCWLGRNNLTYFPGYIDDFRVTIGVARSGSEVPTAAFPDS